MKTLTACLAIAWTLTTAAPFVAAEAKASALRTGADETWTGTLVCAFCGLKKPDAKECQDVLLVTNDKGATVEYYIAKNDATNGEEACTLKIPAIVTGTSFERDGKLWIEPSKIEKKQ